MPLHASFNTKLGPPTVQLYGQEQEGLPLILFGLNLHTIVGQNSQSLNV
jgi:hypothetical protein